MAQYDELAAWYDPLYAATGKDHAAEARALLDVAQRLGVRPRSVLDVACGTGQHLAAFGEAVEDLVGIDTAPAMLDIARERLGEAAVLRHGDMRRFDLERTFDLVTCLFSAIGHVRDESDLDVAIATMATHVAPGGALLVETWLTPDDVKDEAEQQGGYRMVDTAETADGVVARVARSHVRGDALVLQFGWSVADADGVRTAEETFRMPLFDRDRYLAAVQRTGLEPQWLEVPALRSGRGLLVGVRTPEGS